MWTEQGAKFLLERIPIENHVKIKTMESQNLRFWSVFGKPKRVAESQFSGGFLKRNPIIFGRFHSNPYSAESG